MVQSAEKRNCHDLTQFRRFFVATHWRVTVKTLVRSMLVVILKILGQGSSKMPIAQYDCLVKTFPADRTDQSFDVSILPWAVIGRFDFFDTKAGDTLLKRG